MSGKVEQSWPNHPWVRGNLRIDASVLRAIEEDALRCYPSEACGFVMGPTEDTGLLNAMSVEQNEADKYHKLDPERFPRTSKMYFKMNELRASRAFEEGNEKGRPIKVIYHSHCDAGAYFSEEDAATFASDNKLMWPCAFLVTSVMNGKIADHKLWIHKAGTNGFEESSLEVLSS